MGPSNPALIPIVAIASWCSSACGVFGLPEGLRIWIGGSEMFVYLARRHQLKPTRSRARRRFGRIRYGGRHARVSRSARSGGPRRRSAATMCGLADRDSVYRRGSAAAGCRAGRTGPLHAHRAHGHPPVLQPMAGRAVPRIQHGERHGELPRPDDRDQEGHAGRREAGQRAPTAGTDTFGFGAAATTTSSCTATAACRLP